MSTTINAANLVMREFNALSLSITDNEREEFFDPRNRDLWMDAFIERLRERYQQRDRIASND